MVLELALQNVCFSVEIAVLGIWIGRSYQHQRRRSDEFGCRYAHDRFESHIAVKVCILWRHWTDGRKFKLCRLVQLQQGAKAVFCTVSSSITISWIFDITLIQRECRERSQSRTSEAEKAGVGRTLCRVCGARCMQADSVIAPTKN